ncbi:MAG: hypothetical protein IJN10_08310 [Firmicutes bacterium]|nr:hypothetical protein [Bacillota bacterium]
MTRNSCWLPELEYYEDYDNDYPQYQDTLYEIFSKDFIKSRPIFEGKQVNIRRHPIEYGKEEAFFHVTCRDYLKSGERAPDFRRCERIRWVRAFIENYNCDPKLCEECEGIKVWREPYKNTTRVHMLLEEERYMVVVERRESYCLLVTAFYFEEDHSLRKKLKRYAEYKSNEELSGKK